MQPPSPDVLPCSNCVFHQGLLKIYGLFSLLLSAPIRICISRSRFYILIIELCTCTVLDSIYLNANYLLYTRLWSYKQQRKAQWNRRSKRDPQINDTQDPQSNRQVFPYRPLQGPEDNYTWNARVKTLPQQPLGMWAVIALQVKGKHQNCTGEMPSVPPMFTAHCTISCFLSPFSVSYSGEGLKQGL